MILWIALSSVLALLIFLLTRWVGVTVEKLEAGTTVRLNFARLKFTVYPGGSGKKGGEKKKREEVEQKTEEGQQEDKFKKGIDFLKLGTEITGIIKYIIKFLGRHGRVAELELWGRIGTGDPYLTGTLTGLIEALKGVFTRSFSSARVEIQPEFGEEKLELAGIFGVEIRIIQLFVLLILILWKLPKRKVWKMVRNS
jgi:hypothetical protein